MKEDVEMEKWERENGNSEQNTIRIVKMRIRVERQEI